jgi:integrase
MLVAMKTVKGLFEKTPGSGDWWIRYTDARGQYHREKVGRRSDALTLLEKRRTEALQRKKLPEKFHVKGITFADLAGDALEHSRAHNGDRSTKELELKLTAMVEAFGDQSAEDINKQDITRWLVDEAEKRNWRPATRNRWQAAFSLVFRVGVDNEKIERNPAARIKRKAENNGRVRFLTHDEEARLRAAIADSRTPTVYLAALDIALHTGLRMSEQFSLTWSQVDLAHRMLHLPVTKNGKPHNVTLNAVALAAFETLKKMTKGSSYVFPTKDGVNVKSTRMWFDAAVTRADIKDVTWHTLRHTFASRLVMAGVDLRTVGELMNHSSYQMTLRYAHLAPEHKASALDRLVDQHQISTSTGPQNQPTVSS